MDLYIYMTCKDHDTVTTILYRANGIASIYTIMVTGSASELSPHLATVLFNAVVSTVETVDSNWLRVADDSSVKLYGASRVVPGISPAVYVIWTGILPSVSSVHRCVELRPVQVRTHSSPWQASP